MKSLWGHKFLIFILYGVCYGVFYTYPNLYPLSEPAYLPMLAIDTHTPFLPWTFLVYTSDYLLIFLTIVMTNREQFRSFTRMALGVLFMCGFFFIVFPTTYPRPVYPELSNPIVQAAMDFIAMADQPTNCFPSQHVALTGVCAWTMREFGKKIHIAFWIWGVAIFISTLTTKQHYFYDILGGLVVMAAIISLEKYVFGSRSFKALLAKVTVK